jgi:CubicO group peptidase (beta-lactamase class C family)
MTRLLRLTSILLLIYAHTAIALEYGNPGAAGLLPDRLERVDRLIEKTISDDKIKGAVALVARNGQIVYHKAFGLADAESKTPMATDSIFRIASMTKAVTTVAAMMLYENGHFQLNDPISLYLPEFADMRVITDTDDNGEIRATAPATSKIRIIDLLVHASGIAYPFTPTALQQPYVDAGIIDGLTVSEQKLADQMRLLAKQPLLFEPGSSYMYGLNSDLLGYLVEVVSGQPLDEFFAEHITAPLGMNDTYFYIPDDKASRLATLYAHVEGEGLVLSNGRESDIKMDDPRFPITGARSYFSGGAGLSSTAYDYALFIQMLLNGGDLDGVRILSRKSVELMSATRVDTDGDGKADLGLGFSVVTNLGESGELGSIGAYAWGGAFNTTFWIDPQENLIAVFMSQVRPRDTDIGLKFKTAIYQALE